jgi:3-dehydroquinate synthase
VFLLTDRPVAAHHLPAVRRALRAAGCSGSGLVLASGERQKSLAGYRRVLSRMLAAGVERTDTLVALGGGVIGDLGGFAAATYLRGIPLVQLPTTLLAMVDSAIGGKVAVNLPEGKNLAGAFHPPRLVYAALTTLDTLPQRELRSGLAEVVKAGMIGDPALVRHLERHASAILNREPARLAAAIARAVRVKARVVAMDEHERGRRMILNYGHTIGHAIEAATDYRRFRHGEAVALGMAAAAHLGIQAGVTPPSLAERQNRLLELLGLPIRAAHLPVPVILDKLRYDKKIRDGKLRFVLTPQIGSASVREQPVGRHLSSAILSLTMN